MGSCYAEPPINPFSVPYTFPAPDYFSASPKEFCSPFVSSFSREDLDTWYPDPPINTSKDAYFPPPPDYFSSSPKEFCYSSAPSFSPEDIFKFNCYGWKPSYNNPFTSSFSLSYPQPDLTLRTLGEGLHELHGNSSSVTPKAIDDGIALAIVGGWVNISDADGNKPTDTLYGKTASDVCGDSNGKLTTVESMGTAASAHNWNSKEKSSESMAARDTSGEKDTGGGGGGAGENHTCEELSGRGSCGDACYTCAEADHFARKCILGADCGWSGHHTSGNNTDSYVV